MGGRSVGGAEIDVGANFSRAKQETVEFGRTFGKSLSGIFVPTKVAAEGVAKELNKVAVAQQKLIAQQKALSAKKAAEIFTIPEKGAAEIARLTANLNRAERAFAGTGQQSQKLANYIEILRQKINAVRAAHGENLLPVSQIRLEAKEINSLRAQLNELQRAFKGKLVPTSAANEMNRLKDAIEKHGAATDRTLNFIQRHAAAINQLAFSAARAGSGFANFLPLIARSSTLLANMGGSAGGAGSAFSKLTGALGAAKGALAGISFGAIAAAAAIALVVLAIGFLTAKLGPLGSELNRAQEGLKNIFGKVSGDVQNFAERASTAFGITEQAALAFLGKTGQLFQSFGIGVQRSAELSKSLLVISDVLRSTTQTFIDSETAMQALFDVAAGNIEGLRQFGIFLTEVSIKETIRAHKINITTETLNAQQRSLAALLAVNDEAIRRFEQYTKTQDSAARVSERTAAAFKDIKAKLGEGLAPLLAFVANAFLGFLVGLKGIIENAQDFFDKHPLIVKALKAIAAAAFAMVPGLELLIKVVGHFGDEGKEAAEKALNLEERMAELLQGGKNLEDQLAKTFEPTIEQLQQLADAHNRVKEAAEDAARAEKEALKDLTRAREDAIRDSAEAQRDLQETIEDAEEKLFEARKKIKDIEKKNFRDIRDAERALKKERLDSVRRVDDAERALFEARKKRQDSILAAQTSVFEAMLKGDALEFNRAQRELAKARDSKDVSNAKRKLAEEEFDVKEKIALLEEKLLETRLDAYEALKEAERELGNVIEENNEAILTARRKLHDVEVQISRELYDSAQALVNARREGKKSIEEAEESLSRLNRQFGTMDQTLAEILDKLERMKNAILAMSKDEFTAGILGDGGPIDTFAHGGQMYRGQIGLVGERGPELFIPNTNGEIISNDVLLKLIKAMDSGRGGSSGHSIVVNEVANDPEATAFAVSARLGRELNP